MRPRRAACALRATSGWFPRPWRARRGLLFAVFETDDQAQARPRVVDGADLVVHEARGQRDVSDDVFGEVGLDAGGLLGPGDPEAAVLVEAGAGTVEGLHEGLQVVREEN